MKKLLLIAGLLFLASPAFAKEYTIKEVSDPAGKKPYYFEPSELTIQPGDTVTFVDAQEDMHDVMFGEVPNRVDEMIMSPMLKKEGDKFSSTFKTPGTYRFHCHPHEALGMTGTLIVGEASKPGETKIMNHHKMAAAMKTGSGSCGCGGSCTCGSSCGMGGEHKSMCSAAEQRTESALPQGTGKINSVDAERHTINVSHDPIKALGWPKMRMEFQVGKGVDLSGIKAGDTVSFTLKPVGDDDYIVTTLKKTQ